MDYKLTNQVKAYAYSLGADLVGVANIERFDKAPIMMSPQGILPSAKSVIVCAIHHPDACIELGGEPEPQDIGPYRIQYVMNSKLDFLSFKIGRFLEDIGYKTVPIASSNIWRYRGYKELDAIFAPDISHIYASVAAGLSEMGWNGLAITPEYGARNRFVSIITEAELEPTPIYNGPKICDMCGECIRNCPTDAYRKEVDGVKEIEIDDKIYKFANKNLWRCAWGEHFDLDLNLDIPARVDEDVILENVKRHGRRGGEFGVCVKVCLPPNLRYDDPSYTSVYRRKRHFIPNNIPMHRKEIDNIAKIANTNGIDVIGFLSKDELQSNGVDINKYLPDGNSAIILGTNYRLSQFHKLEKSKYDDLLSEYKRAAQLNLDFSALDISRDIEHLGFSALPKSDVDTYKLAELCAFEDVDNGDKTWMYEVILTSAILSKNKIRLNGPKQINRNQLKSHIKKVAREMGADLIGVSSVTRINKIVEQLKPIKEGEPVLEAYDQNNMFMTYEPIIAEVERKIYYPSDYVNNAKSVIVLGLHFPEATVERAKKPPAEAVGPYVFAQYEAQWLLGCIGLNLVKELNNCGFNAMYTFDLMGVGSQVGSPRGYLFSSICNSFEAVAAGLGSLTYNGNVYTNKYGINQRFIAIVTDANLEADYVVKNDDISHYCNHCQICFQSCPVQAISSNNSAEIDIEGIKYRYNPLDTIRCEWSSKYALCGEDGFKYSGSEVDIMPPQTIDKDSLAEALRKTDPIIKCRPVTAESCIIECPMANGQFKLKESVKNE